MEEREDLKSIAAYLPLVARSSTTLFWPPRAVDVLKWLRRGPAHTRVVSGGLLSAAIADLRSSLSLPSDSLSPSALQGYALYFDELISWEESKKWFEEVVPALANLLLRLPSLLESHYRNADVLINGVETTSGLRLLKSQEAGIVLLSQELIGALLGCSFFCLFPVSRRGHKHLPTINFDTLFASLRVGCAENQQNKIHCIIHYFERICEAMPVGSVSFERKVLPMNHSDSCISYPDADFWSNSRVPLCQFEAHSSGLIEDQPREALEVDFANMYLGGGALHRGCVQEEIRFMINPELIAGMLFFPALADNESIEIVGSERFSNYTGYASSFRFAGSYVDMKEIDSLGRRKTRIIAIDALCSPGSGQYRLKNLVRESNKALCGFVDQSKYHQYAKIFRKNGLCGGQHDRYVEHRDGSSNHSLVVNESTTASLETHGGDFVKPEMKSEKDYQSLMYEASIGIATGNWGCGAFGGDPEIKVIIQWLAASQSLRPFVSYHTFGEPALKNIEHVTRWIASHEWTVGELWNMMVEYSWQVLNRETDNVGFFRWLLPSPSTFCDN